MTKRTARVAGLDGLRGLAILLVISHHFFRLPGGWVGVDIFFVLSGFLITTILRAERAREDYWRIYAARRATRILPAYIAMMIAAVALLGLDWRHIWPYYTFFGANIAAYRFGEGVAPLSALWSLAVEEHFYFVWPAIVRKCSDRMLSRVAIACLLAEPALRSMVWLAGMHDAEAFYVLTPFRLDGLALGALFSIWLSSEDVRSKLVRWNRPLLLVMLAVCFVCFVLLRLERTHDGLFFPALGYSIITLTSGCLLVDLILFQDSMLGAILTVRPMLFLARISYGLYIYHELIIALWNQQAAKLHMSHARSLVSLPLSLLLSWLSFRYLETPFLMFGKRLVDSRRRNDSEVAREVAAVRSTVSSPDTG